MGRVVKKIVLTGGPCAGKSSSLELIRNHLSSLGYLVLVVNESATEMINSGIKPFGDDKLSMYDFQDILLKYQLFKEKIVNDIANDFFDKDIVILFDRGIEDSKAYIKEYEYNDLLIKYNLKGENLLNRYDVIIFLETGAKGDFYRTDNNNARSESREEAIDVNNKTYNAWKLHKNMFKVKCYDNFLDKQNEIIRIINKVLNN